MKRNYVGRPVSMIIDCDDIDEVRETGENIFFDRKVFYQDLRITVKAVHDFHQGQFNVPAAHQRYHGG